MTACGGTVERWQNYSSDGCWYSDLDHFEDAMVVLCMHFTAKEAGYLGKKDCYVDFIDYPCPLKFTVIVSGGHNLILLLISEVILGQ